MSDQTSMPGKRRAAASANLPNSLASGRFEPWNSPRRAGVAQSGAGGLRAIITSKPCARASATNSS